MEISEGFNRFEDLRAKAYYAHSGVNRKFAYFDKKMAKRDYLTFINERMSNSTQAKIAMHEVVNNDSKSRDYFLNKRLLLKDPILKNADSYVKSYEKDMYPKTLKLRNNLIKNDRINLDSVTPKLSGLKKLLLKLKTMV